jgi:hypothetical protein
MESPTGLLPFKIDVNTINPVALRKNGLTSFTLNCGLQQAKNIIIVEHVRVETQIGGVGRI